MEERGEGLEAWRGKQWRKGRRGYVRGGVNNGGREGGDRCVAG